MVINELRTYSQMDLDKYLNSRLTDQRDILGMQAYMVNQLAAQALPLCHFHAEERRSDRMVLVSACLRVLPHTDDSNVIVQQMALVEQRKDIEMERQRRRW